MSESFEEETEAIVRDPTCGRVLSEVEIWTGKFRLTTLLLFNSILEFSNLASISSLKTPTLEMTYLLAGCTFLKQPLISQHF